ncbi:YopX family protein [Bacillus sonorensis]|uniref:Phage YopX like protein n=1 Tax=Bacillus sonorensis L12 TaxID=1274524 RepID=M5PAA9_9BACI|nr:YopX family protein [Bacillus sonorensis]EME72255.1 phage YopX like protein [Bacillus sonorensis L12]MCZ0075419.1 YopX family protein [Bacillus sonorensis]MCZ0093073.1 YopX family protein [Bacillus sonorensis]PAD57975.1 hypothetical protein CHH92_22290 [Bacillus sonorensis]
MEIIKIRYTFRHKGSGNIEMKWYSIGQLEERAAAKLSPVFSDEYELISRDLFTGLKDKNGRMIYDRDIWDIGRRFQVEFEEDRCGYFPFANDGGCGCCADEVYQPYEGDIIGNIYENPDLLEAAEE